MATQTRKSGVVAITNNKSPPFMSVHSCPIRMRRIAVIALLNIHLCRADCPECCVPPESPAAKTSKAIQCSGCGNVAMQIGCMMDKVGALCGIVSYLQGCIKKESAPERQKCAAKNQEIGLPDIIMGEGPDTGDTGILSDYQLCCQWGSTDSKDWKNQTCMDMFETAGLKDQVWEFHQKYWGCVSPGTRTTPKGNWTTECNELANDVVELMESTLKAHDAYLKPCTESTELADAVTAKCEGSGGAAMLTPQIQQEMWDDWQAIAFGHGQKARTATQQCLAANWKPGCSEATLILV